MNIPLAMPEALRGFALQAVLAGRHEQAINLLTRASQAAPDDGELLYLLAAEYAETGFYLRACELMAQAIELAPELNIARLQLGMLHLSCGSLAPGFDVLSPLTSLPQDDWIGCFAKGLVHLCTDEFSDCQGMLERGMFLNNRNPALNADMEKILVAIASRDGSNRDDGNDSGDGGNIDEDHNRQAGHNIEAGHNIDASHSGGDGRQAAACSASTSGRSVWLAAYQAEPDRTGD